MMALAAALRLAQRQPVSRRNRKHGPAAQDIVIEKPWYEISWFRSRARLQLKA